ncbi:hypothetical protein HK105_203164 [Polyrhizophydium stewartii]|uniref:Uncharacterized protein n=1 Tax=Polyrhizophydium stewartii TaxID=2732419 RepID=A0ABR4NC53_9FUNG
MQLTTIALAAVASASLPLAAARFQNENDPAFKAILAEIHDSVCVGSKFNAGECPTAAGAAISTVLAAASACAQQDAADGFIDLANKGVTDAAKKARFIVLAQQFRAHERNSVPNPCSPICDRPPKNKQLLGIIQAQDPACKAIPALPAAQAQAIAANPAQVKANLAAVGQKAVNSGQSSAGSEAGDTSDNTTDTTEDQDNSTGDDSQDSQDQSGNDDSGSDDNDSSNDDSGNDDTDGDDSGNNEAESEDTEGNDDSDNGDTESDETENNDDSGSDDNESNNDESGDDDSGNDDSGSDDSGDDDSGDDDSGSDDSSSDDSSSDETGSTAVTFKAGDFQCIDDTRFKHFTSETAFVEGRCPAGLCFTRSPPLKNPCIGKEAAQRIDGTGSTGGSGAEPSTTQGRRRGRANPPPATGAASTSAPATPAGNGKGQFAFRCQNGKDAQAAKLRALGGSCTEGENVCLANGQFGQCVGGKLVGTACAGGLSCQVLPLRNKSGTSVTCSTAADRTARIAEALESC